MEGMIAKSSSKMLDSTQFFGEGAGSRIRGGIIY